MCVLAKYACLDACDDSLMMSIIYPTFFSTVIKSYVYQISIACLHVSVSNECNAVPHSECSTWMNVLVDVLIAFVVKYEFAWFRVTKFILNMFIFASNALYEFNK